MEEEGSSVRLVRCPKCENLLPELPEYSVYQCGGCGAVLRGKQSTPARERRPLERSDNENGVRVSEKKEKVSLESSGSLIDRENDEFDLGRRQGKTVHEKISKLSASSSSKKEKREIFTDSDQIRRRRLDFDQTKVTVFNDWDMNVPKYGESQEIRHPFGPIRSRPIGIHRNSSTIENDRFGNSPYPEGPSSSHSYGGLNELTRVHDLENDRAQLLQKLDELRTQLTKSCNVTENPNVRLNAPYPWPHQPPPLPHQHPHHQYLPPTYHDPFIGYNQDSLFHRPSCTCPQCYNTNSHNILPKVRPFPSFNTRETTYPTHDPLTYNPRQLPRHLDSGSGSFGRRYPRRRVILSHGGERVSRPISGGAPFISCCNCFELLKIPKKLTFMEKVTHKKMKCAVCSSLISLTLEDNRIVTSVSPSHQKYKGTTSKGSVHSSRDYDKSGYNFQLTDTEPNSLSNEQSPDGLTDKPLFLAENFESQDDDLSHSQRVIVDQSIGNKKCLKDAMVATEIDVSLTDYLKCDGVSKEDDELKNKKGEKESFFAGLIKKRLKDFSRSSSVVEKGRSDYVFVNGQLLTDRAVKKAEKLAGPVHPGEYWYDSIAGFWGVMNQPCLGIIPPFIEEFDYTMPKNCAAGNTRVYVNGRELNQRDLDLLAGRGLPTTKDKSYIIDISGKVVDEDSGEELDGLGKLAPTVERVKHGFGMKVPKAVVSK